MRGSDSLQAGKHMEVRGEWCTGQGTDALCLFHMPCPAHLFHLDVHLYPLLHSFMINWPTPWVLWANTPNYWPKESCCHLWSTQLARSTVTTWTCEWCLEMGGQSCRTGPLTCGIWCCPQVDSLRRRWLVGHSAGVRALLVGVGNPFPTHIENWWSAPITEKNQVRPSFVYWLWVTAATSVATVGHHSFKEAQGVGS